MFINRERTGVLCITCECGRGRGCSEDGQRVSHRWRYRRRYGQRRRLRNYAFEWGQTQKQMVSMKTSRSGGRANARPERWDEKYFLRSETCFFWPRLASKRKSNYAKVEIWFIWHPRDLVCASFHVGSNGPYVFCLLRDRNRFQLNSYMHFPWIYKQKKCKTSNFLDMDGSSSQMWYMPFRRGVEEHDPQVCGVFPVLFTG